MAREFFDDDDFEDDGPTSIAVCPDCGSDDLRLTDVVDVDDNEQYECQDCGAFFFYDEEED